MHYLPRFLQYIIENEQVCRAPMDLEMCIKLWDNDEVTHSEGNI